jgi:uncharacterized protein YueI
VTEKFTDRSPLEQKILAGIHGTPELKREERRRLLGQFRERVIRVLTLSQIAEPGTYPEITNAIAHPMARRLIISRKADITAAAEYIRLARKHQLSFTTVDLPDFKGPIGLVVAADIAVDQEEITVPNRVERLQLAGIPQPVIDAKGRGLCKACMEKLRRVDPAELDNYHRISLLDRLVGNKCPCKTKL